MKSWVELSRDQLQANFQALGEVAGAGVEVLAVVKANGYGHNAAMCAVALAGAGARWLGVTDAAEGAACRDEMLAAGVRTDAQPEILLMCGSLPGDATLLIEHRLTPVVWTPEQVRELQDAVVRAGSRSFPVHLEIDTGMARQGCPAGAELRAVLDALAASDRLRVAGVMTHFASAEIAGSALTREQCARFEEALGEVRARGLRPEWIHAGNTSTLDNPHSASGSEPRDLRAWIFRLASGFGARAMVRSGLGLYGYALPVETAGATTARHPELHGRLGPVLQWKTRVLSVREIEAGATVGYNATFTALTPMRLALLPVGYADGLRRELSGSDQRAGGWVILLGQRAPIVGRVSMNLTTVDVSAIPGAAAGDEAVLLGEGVSAEDHARLAGTIPYEILCGLRPDQWRWAAVAETAREPGAFASAEAPR